MASLASKLTSLLQSPQGRRLADKAKAAAAKPENREKLTSLMAKISGKGPRR
ncbi:hypothetical protein ABIB25_002933 [Nakamurella sp. UYEF19]|uniref:hypothetical protein n=1 Tax=Nakamurella sp. UYEF19 TaxID=1756392 RepID=UPI003392DEF1